MLRKLSIPQYFLLAIALIFILFVVYSPHFYYDYSYPLHYDEWMHINAAKLFVNSWTGGLELPTKVVMNTQYEYAFDILLGLIEAIPAIDLVTIYQFLPAILALANCLLLFYLVWQISKNYYAGVLSIFLFAMLKSNINLLGLWFFLPSTLSYLFLLLVLIFLHKFFSTKNKKYLYLFYFFYLLLFVFYPPNAIFVFPVILLVYLINKGFKEFVKILLVTFVIVFVSIIINYYFARYYWDINFLSSVLSDLKNLIFIPGWSGFSEHTYFLPAFFGYIASVFALIGFIVNIKNKKTFLINFLALWVIINLILYKLFEFTIFSFYQRIFYLGLICMVIFSALGVVYVFKKIVKLLNLKKSLLAKGIYIFLALVISSLVLFQPIKNYYQLDETLEPSRVVNEDDLRAFDFIKTNYQKEVIIAPALFSVVIYPLTDNYTVALLTDMIVSRGNTVYDPYVNFLIRNDEARKIIYERYNFDLVYTTVKLDSEILDLLYDQNSRYIYRVEY